MAADGRFPTFILGSAGVLTLLVGSGLRFWPGLASAGFQEAAVATIIAVAAFFAAWLARPAQLGWLATIPMLLASGWGVGLAIAITFGYELDGIQLLPRALELCGGALWLTATASAHQGRLRRGLASPPRAPRFGKVKRVDAKKGATKVAASALSEGDTLELGEGDLMPVDGTIVEGRLRTDRTVPLGRGPEREVFDGELLYAGEEVTAGEASVRVEAVGERTRLRRAVDDVQRIRDWFVKAHLAGTALSVLVVALGLGVVALANWLQGLSAWVLATTGAAGAVLALGPAMPLLALRRAAVEAVEQLMAGGLWLTSPQDVSRCLGARRWWVDPELALAVGTVEVRVLSTATIEEIVRLSLGLIGPFGSPLRSTLEGIPTARDAKTPKVTDPDWEGEIYRGSIDGERLVLGPFDEVVAELNIEASDALRTLVDGLRGDGFEPLLLADRDGATIGLLGVRLAARDDIRRWSSSMEAALLPTYSGLFHEQLAEVVGAVGGTREPRAADAVLLAEKGPRPEKGWVLREERTELRTDGASFARVVLDALPLRIAEGRSLQAAGARRAAALQGLAVVLAAGLAAVGLMEPAFGALLGRAGLLLAFSPYRAESD